MSFRQPLPRTADESAAPRSAAAGGAAPASAPQDRSRIELVGVTKRFVSPTGAAMTALRDVDFVVEPGQFCAVVGPTGCGKSTTLTMVAGLDRPTAGVVRVGGAVVDGIPDSTSFMFQHDALLPWKSVLQNVALGPRFRGESKASALGRAREWLHVVGLSGFEDHHPHQLSGGMRKRATLAASLISEPSILLMDEPFGALDVQTKAIMSSELLTVWERTRPSVIFIAHD
ncbi:MAG: ATP-binding cassette domain-containing protein, partial [Cellulomonas sp.]|nr:ATP-binding cassette domain-containing protein [Cellulomonas sp.]